MVINGNWGLHRLWIERGYMWKYVKNVLDAEFSPWPKWLWFANLGLIAVSILIIVWLW